MCQMILQMFNQIYRRLFQRFEDDALRLELTDDDDKIMILEKRIAELEEKNGALQQQIDYHRNKEAALQKVLCNYDNLLTKVVIEKSEQKQEESAHLASLETAFVELLQKYEKTKAAVYGSQQNESALKRQVVEYEDILESLRKKFLIYKNRSGKKLKVCDVIRKMQQTEDTKKTSDKRRRLITTL